MLKQKVYHHKYGHGITLATRHKNFEFYVKFDNGICRWIRRDELSGPKVQPKVYQPTPKMPLSKFKSRRIIESLRLGIVPQDCITDFIFGRKREIEEYRNWLNGGKSSIMFLVGGYGAGKTHLINYYYREALEMGFAVSHVSLDRESPLYKPKRVYNQIVKNFQCLSNNSIKGFRDLVKSAIQNKIVKDHIYFRCLADGINEEIYWEWIEGGTSSLRPIECYFDRNIAFLPGLYDYTNTANIYCYLISGIGWVTKKLGLKGLILIFDEAEHIDVYDYKYQLKKSENFFKAMIPTTNNDKDLLKAPSYYVGLDYCKVGPARYVPFIYKNPTGLNLLFAFTDIDILQDYFDINNSVNIYLEPIEKRYLRRIFKGICDIYSTAYGKVNINTIYEDVFKQVLTYEECTRTFVKGSVEALDLIRLNRWE